jgi:lysozyme family protein
MADFEQAVEKVLVHEGGYSDLKADRGGETYKGIARKHHPKWPGWKVIDKEKSRQGFPKRLNKNSKLHAHVKALYRAQYWLPINGDKQPNQGIAEEIFDTGVNMGIRRSAKFLQASINLLNRNQAMQADLLVDGSIGSKTIAALKTTIKADKSNRYVVLLLNLYQGMRYINILQANPSQEIFTRGWIKRTI